MEDYYRIKDVSVNAYIKDESLWVTQKAMSELFGVDKSGISRHLKNIFSAGELDEKVVVAKIATTTQHGAIKGKTQISETNYYKSGSGRLCGKDHSGFYLGGISMHRSYAGCPAGCEYKNLF